MNHVERDAALRTLRFLCKGARIEGLNFYGLRLLLSESEHNSNRIDGQIYINIESPFYLFDSMPTHIPSLNELPKIDLIESSQMICELRLKQIVDVSLSLDSPHLFITFETGEVLFIWGKHAKYESWQVGVSNNAIDDEHWEVVACSNDGLAIWGAEDICSSQ